MDKLVKYIFGNPWIVCVVLTGAGAIAVMLALDHPPIVRVLAGGVAGLAMGFTHVIEVKMTLNGLAKRSACAAIGVVAALAVAALLGTSGNYYLAYAVVGAALGATAKDWVRYVNLP